MIATSNRRPQWYFYPAWVVLTTMAIPMAWVIAWGLISLIEGVVGGTIQIGGQTRITEDALLAYILYPLLSLLIGLLQYVLLHRYLSRAGWWIAGTMLGWPLGGALIYVTYTIWPFSLSGDPVWLAALALAFVGTTTGLLQWLVLRRQVGDAGWWILASLVGWGLAGLFLGATITSPAEMLIVGAVPGAVTGLVLWWLLARRPASD
jgi:hypothetical protein